MATVNIIKSVTKHIIHLQKKKPKRNPQIRILQLQKPKNRRRRQKSLLQRRKRMLTLNQKVRKKVQKNPQSQSENTSSTSAAKTEKRESVQTDSMILFVLIVGTYHNIDFIRNLTEKEKEVVVIMGKLKKNTDVFLSLHIRTQIWSIYL